MNQTATAPLTDLDAALLRDPGIVRRVTKAPRQRRITTYFDHGHWHAVDYNRYDGATDAGPGERCLGTSRTSERAAILSLLDQEDERANANDPGPAADVKVEILGRVREVTAWFDYASPERGSDYAGHFDIVRVIWSGVDVTDALDDEDREAIKEAIADQQRAEAEAA